MDFSEAFLQEKGLFTREQVMTMLGITNYGWYKLVNEGLPVIKLTSKAQFVKRDDLESHLEKMYSKKSA
ncbi:hypothetical protein R9C00_19660 [Flammeovirgaceae bacterium SG7u.111]|nr:hypothetical protein [Flammeovirgaceae bacterium SG7u.132]WPO33919.1 hypothetical protein R9C00_19660 [Flammeovirgaceae bacterium SG7u.111]